MGATDTSITCDFLSIVSDFMERFPTFKREKPIDPVFRSYAERAKSYNELKKKNVNFTSRQFEIFGPDIDRIIQFTRDCGARLLFCLNSHQRTPKKKWDLTNMFDLIDYFISKNFTEIDFGIGNEPKKIHNVTGESRYSNYMGEYHSGHYFSSGMSVGPQGFAIPASEVGAMVRSLRRKLDNSTLKESMIIAPDLSSLSKRDKFATRFIRRMIKKAKTSLSGVSFHQYYVKRNSTWTDMIDPRNLNKLQDQISKAQNVSYVETKSR